MKEIPQSFLKWLYKEVSIDLDLIDVEAEYDHNITESENKEEFKNKFPSMFNNEKTNKEMKEYEQIVIKEQQFSNDKIIFKDIFNKPKIIGLVADQNEGKSNTLYYIIEELRKDCKFNLYAYGLRSTIKNVNTIHSVAELEQIKNSIIIIDEMFSLFDLDNRKIRGQIENTIRLIHHNNNVLILCGLPDNFKKFISAKLNIIIYKKLALANLINGSTVKSIIMDYKGDERGTAILNLSIDKALIYDGKHYKYFTVKYLEQYDTKKENVQILCKKSDTK